MPPTTKKNARPSSNLLSYEIHASQKAIDRIQAQTDEERTQFVINTLTEYFADGIRANPTAFHARFRKMAATPFNFYRGSAILFYQDLKVDQDAFLAKNPRAGQIFIHVSHAQCVHRRCSNNAVTFQGDLHAENFGTYLDDDGILKFDVNDFDEGYLGPFTWDVKRLVASLNLICYSKAFSDEEIGRILHACVEAYVEQVHEFCRQKKDQFSLSMANTTGKINELLNETRAKSRANHLDSMTYIVDYDRKFIRSKLVQNVGKDLQDQLIRAFQSYLETIPENKKYCDRGYNGGEITYKIKDIVQRTSPGIGSAGKISYSFLLQGPNETLDTDIVLYMKPAQRSALSTVIRHTDLDKYFHHDGLRTVLCSYGMQASTPRWLGYTTLNSVPCLVDEVSPHGEDLAWSGINDMHDIIDVVKVLGRVTGRFTVARSSNIADLSCLAKIHCVADSDWGGDSDGVAYVPPSIVPPDTEQAIRSAIDGREAQFMEEIVEFGMVTHRRRCRFSNAGL